MKKLPIILFAIVVLAQLAVPASMIVRREMTLDEGRAYRFRTAPVDPYDPFRGKYVSLRLEANTVSKGEGEVWRSGEKAYALLAEDPEGFALFTALSRSRPESGDYLKVRVAYSGADKVHLKLPFDRYYAEESVAPEIERVYFQQSRREERAAWISVRVRCGMGVLEELYIDSMPIGDFILQKRAEEK